jgi:hypothetical protein
MSKNTKEANKEPRTETDRANELAELNAARIELGSKYQQSKGDVKEVIDNTIERLDTEYDAWTRKERRLRAVEGDLRDIENALRDLGPKYQSAKGEVKSAIAEAIRELGEKYVNKKRRQTELVVDLRGF